MRLMLAIPSLERGGAEAQFVRLVNGLRRKGHQVCAVVLGSGGPFGRQMEGPAHCLGKDSRLGLPFAVGKLAALAWRERPEVYYGLLPMPNLMGAALKILRPGLRLVFGLRASDMRLADYGMASRVVTRLETAAAGLADLVVCNSEAGRSHAISRGVAPGKLRVAHNGIDTARCRPDRALGLPLRGSWGVGAQQPLIGLVARLDPMKDHENFLQAAALVARSRPEARFVCVGGGPREYADGLRRQAQSLGLGEKLIWTGALGDMPAVYNALDLLCLSSAYGEGFPNVLGEALACGVPCVTTDVGDAALVVGGTGAVAPRRDPEALAAALLAQLERLEREGDGLRRACRARVEENFSVERMVETTEALLLGLTKAER